MEPSQNLFLKFPQHSKEDWLTKINKDLKGRSLADLDWALEERIKISAILSAEDLIGNFPPLIAQRPDNNWQIGTYVAVRNMGEANAQVLEELKGGINAPLFQLRHLPSLTELEVLLKDIEPDFISAHFALQHPGKDPAEFFRNIILYTRRRKIDLAKISGSVDFDPLLDWTNPPFKPLARILRFAQQHTPQFKVLQINGQVLHAGAEFSSRELALMIAKGVEYLDQLQQLGVDPGLTNKHLQFSLANSCSYFVEIAKIRALKILWANVLDGYGISDQPLPPISAHPAPETQTENTELNMVRATTQAMAAAIGGAATIYVLPADISKNEAASAFTRRIARNVQHLLQLESHLGQVTDPAAGSYYIETLTQALCQNAWEQLKDIEAKGGYLNFIN
jgi:methylmalonyl-CoA mutase